MERDLERVACERLEEFGTFDTGQKREGGRRKVLAEVWYPEQIKYGAEANGIMITK